MAAALLNGLIAMPALIPALIPALFGAPAWAQVPEQSENQEAEMPQVVRGQFQQGEVSTDWEAMVEQGRPVRITEWRRYGEQGDATVVFDFHNGDLMHYGERSRRVAGQAGVADGYARVSLHLNFTQGRYVSGRKQVDGIDTEPDEPEIQGALAQARTALERLAATRGRGGIGGQNLLGLGDWSEIRRSLTPGGGATTTFGTPPTPPAPRFAPIRPGEIAFRCDDNLRLVLGSVTAYSRRPDSLILEQAGRPPIPLLRQPPDGRYEYLGRGWAATRFGENIQLDSASGQSWSCSVVAAVPPSDAVPPGNTPPAPAPAYQQQGAPPAFAPQSYQGVPRKPPGGFTPSALMAPRN